MFCCRILLPTGTQLRLARSASHTHSLTLTRECRHDYINNQQLQARGPAGHLASKRSPPDPEPIRWEARNTPQSYSTCTELSISANLHSAAEKSPKSFSVRSQCFLISHNPSPFGNNSAFVQQLAYEDQKAHMGRWALLLQVFSWDLWSSAAHVALLEGQAQNHAPSSCSGLSLKNTAPQRANSRRLGELGKNCQN